MILNHARFAACLTFCACTCGRVESPSPNAGEDPDTVSAAGADTAAPRPADANASESFSYDCDREYRFVAQVLAVDEAVRLILPDTTVTLPRVVSASGAKYGEGPYTYWSKGDEASIETPAASFTGCLSDEGGPGWREAKARGVRFRAIGQEPGWILDIRGDGGIDVQADYGETVFSLPPSEPVAGPGGRTVYRVEGEAHRVMIVIADMPCRDAMSGWPYESTVSMILDGREYRGCGRWL